MTFVRARLRPMIRVETVVLVVVAWLIATLNGAWWSAVGAGRVWSDPANWLFVAAMFRRAGRTALRVARRRCRIAGRCVRC